MIIDFKGYIHDRYYDPSLKLFRDSDYLILYHGTSSIFLNNIKNNGLLPRELTGNSVYEGEMFGDRNLESNQKKVYLGSFGGASLGNHAVYKFCGELCKIRLLINLNQLVADEDSGKETAAESLAWEGCCAHIGKISLENFLGYYFGGDYFKIREEQKELLEIDNYYFENLLPSQHSF